MRTRTKSGGVEKLFPSRASGRAACKYSDCFSSDNCHCLVTATATSCNRNALQRGFSSQRAGCFQVHPAWRDPRSSSSNSSNSKIQPRGGARGGAVVPAYSPSGHPLHSPTAAPSYQPQWMHTSGGISATSFGRPLAWQWRSDLPSRRAGLASLVREGCFSACVLLAAI